MNFPSTLTFAEQVEYQPHQDSFVDEYVLKEKKQTRTLNNINYLDSNFHNNYYKLLSVITLTWDLIKKIWYAWDVKSVQKYYNSYIPL